MTENISQREFITFCRNNKDDLFQNVDDQIIIDVGGDGNCFLYSYIYQYNPESAIVRGNEVLTTKNNIKMSKQIRIDVYNKAMEIKNHLNQIKRIVKVPVKVTTFNAQIPDKQLGNIVNQEHEVYPDETHYLDDRYSPETKSNFATIFTLTNGINSEESRTNQSKPVKNRSYVRGKVWFDYMSLYSFSEIINKIIIIFDISYYGNIQIIVPKTLDPIINPDNYIMVIRIHAQHFMSFRSEDSVNSPYLSPLHIELLNTYLSHEIECDEHGKQKIIYEIKFNQIYNMKKSASNEELFIPPQECNVIIKKKDNSEYTIKMLSTLVVKCYLLFKNLDKVMKSVSLNSIQKYLQYIIKKLGNKTFFDQFAQSPRYNKFQELIEKYNIISDKINNTQEDYINLFKKIDIELKLD